MTWLYPHSVQGNLALVEQHTGMNCLQSELSLADDLIIAEQSVQQLFYKRILGKHLLGWLFYYSIRLHISLSTYFWL